MPQDRPAPPSPGPAEGDLDMVDALAQLTFFVQGTLARHASAEDLSMIQTRLLGVLSDREPTMRELARLLELDKSSTTGLVDRAERRGLVRRTPSTDDRRSVHVRLTPAGRRTGRRVRAGFATDLARATRCLSPDDRDRLSAMVTRVLEARSGT